MPKKTKILKKQKAEYVTLMRPEKLKKLQEILPEIVVLEHLKWHFRASRFKNFLEGISPDPLAKPSSALKTVSLRKVYPDL